MADTGEYICVAMANGMRATSNIAKLTIYGEYRSPEMLIRLTEETFVMDHFKMAEWIN